MHPNIRTSILISCVLLLGTFPVEAQYDSLQLNGLNRTYLLHLPPGYSGTNPLPLIIAMHGGFGSAANLQNQSGLSQKADLENFIVVYPEGVQSGLLNIRTWNAGWCCGPASADDIDDVGFINALIDTLIENYAVDTNRIYATGMSNGGFMSYRLACELSHRIAAIAPVACAMSLTSCPAARPVPIIHFHSYEDGSVPYQGGVGDGVSNHYNPPLDSILDAWSIKNGCSPMQEVVTDQYTFIQYTDCECQSEIQLYISRDGGHSWPGGEQTIIGDPVSQYIHANDLMWEFFKNHSLDCRTTSTSEITDIIPVEIYPNPTSGRIHLNLLNIPAVQIKVYNALGQEMIHQIEGNEIDLTTADSGIYFIVTRLGDQIQSTRILKYTP